MMKTHIYNLLKYKDLFYELVKKDIKLKYRNSYLGLFWSMLNPLLMMIILSIIFSAIFKNNIAYFPVYVLTGRLIYTMFSESTNFALDSIIMNSNLIRKVYVPKYFFPLSRVCSSFIINIVSLLPMFIVMLVLGMNFSWHLLLIIIPIALLFIFTMGAGLILSTINVFFRDIKHLYSVLLTLVMYSMAIFYPIEIIPEQYRFVFELNPLYVYLSIFRDLVMNSVLPNPTEVLLAFVYAVISFVIGLFVFYKKQDKFIFNL